MFIIHIVLDLYSRSIAANGPSVYYIYTYYRSVPIECYDTCLFLGCILFIVVVNEDPVHKRITVLRGRLLFSTPIKPMFGGRPMKNFFTTIVMFDQTNVSSNCHIDEIIDCLISKMYKLYVQA